MSFYGTDQYILQYDNELGPPWKNAQLYLKLSYPFLEADKRIHTPTLFMGGTSDMNVPILGGEQMYQALKSLGVHDRTGRVPRPVSWLHASQLHSRPL